MSRKAIDRLQTAGWVVFFILVIALGYLWMYHETLKYWALQ